MPVLSEDLNPGMVIGKDIFSINSKVPLLVKGKKLQEYEIQRLKELDIKSVFVKYAKEGLILNEIVNSFDKTLENYEIKFLSDEIRNQLRALSLKIINEKKFLIKSYKYSKRNDMDLVGHYFNVGALSLCFGNYLGFKNSDLVELGTCGCVHDAGKSLDSKIKEIILLPRQLSSDEMFLVSKHSELGFNYFSKCNENLLARINGEHHYPRYGVCKEGQMHIFSDIIKICDVYSALREKRTYADQKLHLETIEIMDSMNYNELRKNGTIISPNIMKKMDQDYFNSEIYENFKRMFEGLPVKYSLGNSFVLK